jgi:DNA-binding FadR family transcriptional regulator
MSKTARPGRLPEIVADRIQSEILTAGLAPGEQLPTEAQLTEQHDVSRTVIREAARILEQRGLVDIRPGRGMIVTELDTGPIARHFGLLLKATPAAFEQLMDIRLLVEVHIAGLAAENRTAEQLAALHEAMDHIAVHRTDFDATLREDLRFHALLAEACGNPLMGLFVDPINQCLRASYQVPDAYLDHIQETIDEHQAILDAIEQQDPTKARAVAEAHLDRVRRTPAGSLARPKAERVSPSRGR